MMEDPGLHRPQGAKVRCIADDDGIDTLMHAMHAQHTQHLVRIQEVLSELHRQHEQEMDKRQAEHEERMVALVKRGAPSKSIPAPTVGKVKSSPVQPQQMSSQIDGKGDAMCHVVKTNNLVHTMENNLVHATAARTESPAVLPVGTQSCPVESMGRTDEQSIGRAESIFSKLPPKSKSTNSKPTVASEKNMLEVKKKMNKVAKLARAFSDGDQVASGAEKFRLTLKKMLTRPEVDCFICFIITCNTVFSAAQADYVAQYLIEADSALWTGFGMFFVIFFGCEILVRMLIEQTQFLTGENRDWNLFDSVIVIITILEQVMSTGSSGRAVRILRVLRVIRVARFLRVLRFFHELRAMVTGILHSFGTLLWVLVLLTMNMFLFAVYVTQIVAYERIEIRDGKVVDEEYSDGLETVFNTLPITLFSLYKAVTGGDDWGYYADLLFKINVFPGLLFCFYVAFTTFAVLNVVTGVFIGNAFKLIDNDTDLTIMEQNESRRKAITDMKQVFRKADSNRSGTISRQEFQTHIQDPCVQAYFRQLGIDLEAERNWNGLFDLLDFDQDEEIDIDEFVSGCLHMRGQARSLDLERCNFNIRNVLSQLRELQWDLRRQCDAMQDGFA